jgi:pimeloyl-ACP methyl ester carboxylesterase
MCQIEDSFTVFVEGKAVRGIKHEPVGESVATIVLLNGYFFAGKTGPGRLFVRLGRNLAAKSLRVVRFDYRGRGDSDGGFSETSYTSAIQDTLSVIAYHSSNSRLILIGHSMGCNIAVATAKVLTRLASLVLLSPHTGSAISPNLFTSSQLAELHKAGKVERKGAQCFLSFLGPVLSGMIGDDAGLVASPVLMLQGTRDEFYSLVGFHELASRFQAPTVDPARVGVEVKHHSYISGAL